MQRSIAKRNRCAEINPNVQCPVCLAVDTDAKATLPSSLQLIPFHFLLVPQLTMEKTCTRIQLEAYGINPQL
jgi:hypothetical protein